MTYRLYYGHWSVDILRPYPQNPALNVVVERFSYPVGARGPFEDPRIKSAAIARYEELQNEETTEFVK